VTCTCTKRTFFPETRASDIFFVVPYHLQNESDVMPPAWRRLTRDQFHATAVRLDTHIGRLPHIDWRMVRQNRKVRGERGARVRNGSAT